MNTDTIERRDGWAMRLADEAERYSSVKSRAEADMAFDFQRAIEAGDGDVMPLWAPTVRDYESAKAQNIKHDAKHYPRRRMTVAEMLSDSLDYGNGPDMGDVVKVLSFALKSSDPMVALAATQLVQRCGAKFAEHNAEVE